VPHCPSLVTETRPCPTHPKRRAWTPRPSTSSRGYNWAWRGVRTALAATGPHYCAHCAAAGRVRYAVELDHVVPLAVGGTHDESNLQWLCIPCHRRKTRREQGA
jgi:5-methylcytosine-specific restriction protein A